MPKELSCNLCLIEFNVEEPNLANREPPCGSVLYTLREDAKVKRAPLAEREDKTR